MNCESWIYAVQTNLQLDILFYILVANGVLGSQYDLITIPARFHPFTNKPLALRRTALNIAV